MNDPTPGFIGKAVERKEDYRFLTGQGQYTDDITQPNQSYAVFVRSPHAHATIRGIDTKAAMDSPGVLAIYTGKDFESVGG
ncbi:MAG TPA: xanthine dehydrogenase family protein molybdopterin-binding subunit, partial [Burkholderiaceae bacterium]|nr:xanthine dehydrogenase family protein molybdopterin-binding subunit [Burkholderiaceae bacterium]